MSEHTGTLVKKIFAAGSKSEHEAVVLEMKDGSFLKVVLRGENPFEKSPLNALLNKRVKIEGTQDQYLLTVEKIADITVLGPPGRFSAPKQPKP